MIQRKKADKSHHPYNEFFFNYYKSLCSQRHLLHTPRTCETGPGNPSGHAMINMVLWYIVADALTSSKIVDNYLGEASR